MLGMLSLTSLYVAKLNLRLLPGAKAGSVVAKDGSSPPQFCSTPTSRDNFSVCTPILMHFTALNRAHRAHKNAKKNEVLSTTVVTDVALC